MDDPKDLPKIEPPPIAKIIKATVFAIVVAGIVLATTVLPAEYGIDPVGAGAALGLVNLSNVNGAPAAPVESGVDVIRPNTYKVDSRDFDLYPGEGFEFKYRMEKGAVMVYSWKADGKLESEFHGEPDVKPNKDYYESYNLDKVGREQGYGSFTAPSTGIHGWFWENRGFKQVKLRLTTAGFYSAGKQYSSFGVEDIALEDVK